jgi:hypothetical protein
MEKSRIKDVLSKTLGDKIIYCEEYQDKFFLFKEIHNELPEISESNIYSAIDQINSLFKSPLTGKKFIDVFVERLIN